MIKIFFHLSRYFKVRRWNEADATIFDHFNATLWRKIKEFGTKKMAIQLGKLQNERDRVAGECLEASQPVVISDLKNNKNGYYQPAGVAMTGYQLSEYGKSNELCQNFVKPENKFSRELFIRQQNFS